MYESDEIFLIVTNIYDGLFSGGLIIIYNELSAELSYPVGESLSLGYVNAVSMVSRFIIRFWVGLITFNEDPSKPIERGYFYILLMMTFLVFTVLSIIFIRRSPLILRRSLADACLEIPYGVDQWDSKKVPEVEEKLIEE